MLSFVYLQIRFMGTWLSFTSVPSIKCVILKNFKILHNDPETKHIFSLPPLISFHDKNLDNFLVRSAFKSDNQPGTFTCKRTRCKTCPFISKTVKISWSGPNRSAKFPDHFTWILEAQLIISQGWFQITVSSFAFFVFFVFEGVSLTSTVWCNRNFACHSHAVEI